MLNKNNILNQIMNVKSMIVATQTNILIFKDSGFPVRDLDLDLQKLTIQLKILNIEYELT